MPPLSTQHPPLPAPNTQQIGYGGRSSHPVLGTGSGGMHAVSSAGALGAFGSGGGGAPRGDVLNTTLFNPGGGAGAGRSRGVADSRNLDVLLKRGDGDS